MLPVRNHLHHRIIITMSQKRKIIACRVGDCFPLASLSVLLQTPLLTGKPLALPWSALSISGTARPLKARRGGEEVGGKVTGVDGGCDNQVHANNHDILLSRKVDAVISIRR